MKIDAHQHFWDPTRVDYFWMNDLAGQERERLVRPVLPAELAPQLARHGVQRTVLVQASQSPRENTLLFELAAQHDAIAGVVAWLDLEAADFEQQLQALALQPKFCGVRPMVQDIPDPEWLLRRPVRRSLEALEKADIAFDFLVKPPQTPAMLEVLKGHPGLRAVLDHLGKPRIVRQELDPWREQLLEAAAHPRLHCKLSGLITEADPERWAPADLQPYVHHAVAAFGPERCLFGSDWPVCTVAGSYDQVVGALSEVLSSLNLDEAAWARIFGGSAAEFYRI